MKKNKYGIKETNDMHMSIKHCFLGSLRDLERTKIIILILYIFLFSFLSNSFHFSFILDFICRYFSSGLLIGILIKGKKFYIWEITILLIVNNYFIYLWKGALNGRYVVFIITILVFAMVYGGIFVGRLIKNADK